MAETVTLGCDGVIKWPWYDVCDDLVRQGGLNQEDIVIDPLSVRPHGCGGTYLGNWFFFTWVRGRFCLLTMMEFSQSLVDAFSAVLEYEPFACYHDKQDMVTVEWDKQDPASRWADLQGEQALIPLPRLSPVRTVSC